MKLRTLCKKKAAVVVAAMFLSITSIGLLGNYDSMNSKADVISTDASIGKYEQLKLTNGKGSIKLDNLTINEGKTSLLVIDINDEYVYGKNNKLDKDSYLVLNVKDSKMSPTVIKANSSEYVANYSKHSRFNIPFVSNGSSLEIEVKGIGKLADAKIKFRIYEYGTIDNELVESKDMNKVDNINSIDTFVVSSDENTTYSSVLGKGEKRLLIRPVTMDKTVRFYFGTDELKSYGKDGKLSVRYYSSTEVFEKIKDDYKKYKAKYSSNDYRESDISIGSGYSTIELPMYTTDGFIEVVSKDFNNYVLKVKAEAKRDTVLLPEKPKDNKPEENKVEKVNPKIERIASNDRYSTSLMLSQKAFASSKNAVIASGEQFADALSGGSLASKLNAPLLLVNDSKYVVASVKNELKRLGVENIIILGGEKSVSKSTEMDLANGIKSMRLAGKDRYETSMSIYNHIKNGGMNLDVLLVNGNSFADALSAGPLSAKKSMPILLTNGKTVKPELNRSGNIVIGGYASMSSDFKGVRVAGSDRYETSAMIASKYFLGRPTILVASGEKYPDGLSSITLYNKYYAPLLLTSRDGVSMSVMKYAKDNKVGYIKVIGGVGSVSDRAASVISNY